MSGEGLKALEGGHRPGTSSDEAPSDEELMRRLALGHHEALGPLYGRYVSLVHGVAAQSLDPSAAEEIVQDVFLIVWRRAETFDPRRGQVRPWLLQVTHTRVLNELRRRSRRPRLLSVADDQHALDLPDPDPEPAEQAVHAQRRRVIRDALDALPPPQRRAVGLAFLDDLTHEQVAQTTNVPLGTAKTRIRTGLQKLRARLTPLMVGAAALVVLGGAFAYRAEHDSAVRHARALHHVTLSDLIAARLTAAPGVPPEAHGTYRARDGADIVVLTVSYLPAIADDRVYQGWARFGETWRSLGTVRPGAEGRAVSIVEGADLGTLPEEVRVTLEPAGGSPAPTGSVVIRWASE